MSALPAILPRLAAGRPILLGCDPATSLREGGAALEGAAPLGRLLREEPERVAEHYKREVEAGSDVLLALTSDTTPRALAHIGMAFRAAALTRCAVDLAIEAASAATQPVVVAGILGNRWVGSTVAERVTEECAMHAARLAASGCELIIARGFAQAAPSSASLARLARVAAVASAKSTRLPTWTLVELDEPERTPDGEALEDYVGAMVDSGAQLVLLEVPRVEVGLAAIDRVRAAWPGAKVGVLLDTARAGGSGDPASIEAWARAAKSLTDSGARVVGGGLWTTASHVAALSSALREHP